MMRASAAALAAVTESADAVTVAMTLLAVSVPPFSP